MIAPLVGVLLLVATAAQDEERSADPAVVAKVVGELENALRTGTADEKKRALDRAGSVEDAAVVAAIEAGLLDPEPEVVGAALEALRWMEHPAALDALHRACRKNRGIKKNAQLLALTLKAIGQHADPSSIGLLAEKPFESKDYDVIRARLLGLGRIRARESVETLLGIMRRASAREVERYMSELRLSLMVLTGTDQGPAAEAWQRWWKVTGKDFEVSPERSRLPRPDLERWIRYWGLDESYGRARRREDRGD